MKVRVEISTNVPRSLYCGKIESQPCDYSAIKQSEGLPPTMFCTLYQTALWTTKKGIYVKCNKCLANLRKELISGG
ncbi:MAG: hypothetical protein PWQ08_1102 [Clostridiales bacterium]|jgi:hypothetical protein|nr:hypothetical protein [Clostridiales bacterium]